LVKARVPDDSRSIAVSVPFPADRLPRLMLPPGAAGEGLDGAVERAQVGSGDAAAGAVRVMPSLIEPPLAKAPMSLPAVSMPPSPLPIVT